MARVAADVQALELKGRVALIAAALREGLPPDYPAALAILLQVLGPEIPEEAGMFDAGWWIMPIAYYVEAYGLEHPEVSLDAIYAITKRHTGEFAIRPYLERYPNQTLARLPAWAEDPNAHMRRLVSEGTRTRLPWGKRLEMFVRDPGPVLAEAAFTLEGEESHGDPRAGVGWTTIRWQNCWSRARFRGGEIHSGGMQGWRVERMCSLQSPAQAGNQRRITGRKICCCGLTSSATVMAPRLSPPASSPYP
jgi:hypothetical protein